ncbi:hypothetical protein BDA99DRAFT_155703 [Phascolomyces articulosus]|uniref:Yeast cell wall synthesis Kre9/Knh1-like N-terminal domain-containing protein n=1 Tax=Phascolomyces articulosus TaxID=60185 RepID=A0AAD5K835_9FUNG|nr:hypothetical protein BDA99DRAFT_155703 [Phascolomyces articulosus]
MVFKSFITTSAAVMAFVSGIAATMAPNYPQPGTVWTAGKEYTLTWGDDGSSPNVTEGWTNFKIDFMTGDNMNMIPLTNVASGLDASKVSSYTWTAPQVDPYSAIYFLQYTNDKGETAWTTRFAIVAQDGATPAPEPEKTQPNGGEAIPWGVGKLASGDAAASSPAASSPAVSSSPAPESSSAAAASSSESASASPAASEESSASPATSAADKKKDTEEGAAGSIRASMGAMAIGLVAAGYALA